VSADDNLDCDLKDWLYYMSVYACLHS